LGSFCGLQLLVNTIFVGLDAGQCSSNAYVYLPFQGAIAVMSFAVSILANGLLW
jgi:hypothetical protein